MKERPGGKSLLEFMSFPANTHEIWNFLLNDCLARNRALHKAGSANHHIDTESARHQIQFDMVMVELLKLLILEGLYDEKGFVFKFELDEKKLEMIDEIVTFLVQITSDSSVEGADIDPDRPYEDIIRIMLSAERKGENAAKRVQKTRDEIDALFEKYHFSDFPEKGSFYYRADYETINSDPEVYYAVAVAACDSPDKLKNLARYFDHYDHPELAARAMKAADEFDSGQKQDLRGLLVSTKLFEHIVVVTEGYEEKPEDFLCTSSDFEDSIVAAKKTMQSLATFSQRSKTGQVEASEFASQAFPHMNEVLDRLGEELQVAKLFNGEVFIKSFSFKKDDLEAMKALIERALEDSRSFDFLKETEATEAARKAIYVEMVEIVRKYIK